MQCVGYVLCIIILCLFETGDQISSMENTIFMNRRERSESEFGMIDYFNFLFTIEGVSVRTWLSPFLEKSEILSYLGHYNLIYSLLIILIFFIGAKIIYN